jgi:hypothetical protein
MYFGVAVIFGLYMAYALRPEMKGFSGYRFGSKCYKPPI